MGEKEKRERVLRWPQIPIKEVENITRLALGMSPVKSVREGI